MFYPDFNCIIYFDLIYPLFFPGHYIEIRNMLLKNTKPETVLMVAQLDFLILDKTKSGCEYRRWGLRELFVFESENLIY